MSEQLTNDLLIKLPSYSKKNIYWFNDLIDKQKTAIINAKRLQKHNKATNSKNPATNMHELIEYLINLKKF